MSVIVAKQYLQNHQAEAFKKIAEAMGKFPVQGVYSDAIYVGADERYNPLTNAEQWIECLFWYRSKLKGSKTGAQVITDLWISTESREELLIAILGVIDEH